MKHITVFLNEAIDLLQINTNGIYADLTLGSGGHSLKILENLNSGFLYVFDLDKSAIENFENEIKNLGYKEDSDKNELEKIKNVSKFSLGNGRNKVTIVNDNFTKLNQYLLEEHKNNLDGILVDLGWSTDQLENIEGLSYEGQNNDLDMRFDENLGVKASDLLNALNKKELSVMFKEYSDIYGKLNEQLVSEIIRKRNQKLFKTVSDLTEIIDKVFKNTKNKNSIYSKVFQALRIAVNQEMINLSDILNSGFESLKINGKFLIITFHSGESKLAEEFFDKEVKAGEASYLTKKFDNKFFTPTVDELRNNINSRSAKLFGIKKIIINK